jgi:hypothetical protein
VSTWRLHGHCPRVIVDDADQTTVATFLRQEDAVRVLELEAANARLQQQNDALQEALHRASLRSRPAPAPTAEGEG